MTPARRQRRFPPLSALALTAAVAPQSGCREDLCKQLPPRVEIAYSVAGPVDVASVAHLRLQMTVAGASRSTTRPPEKAGWHDGAGSLVLTFNDPGQLPDAGEGVEFQLSLLSAQEQLLAQGTVTSPISADGCNFNRIELRAPNAVDPPHGDAGVEHDGVQTGCTSTALRRPALVTSAPTLLNPPSTGVHLVALAGERIARQRWFADRGWLPWDTRDPGFAIGGAAQGPLVTAVWPDSQRLVGDTLSLLLGGEGGAIVAWYEEDAEGAVSRFVAREQPGTSFLPRAMHAEPPKATVAEGARLLLFGVPNTGVAGPLVEAIWAGEFDSDGLPSPTIELRGLPPSATSMSLGVQGSVFFAGNRLNELMQGDRPGPASMVFVLANTGADGADEVWLGRHDHDDCPTWCWDPLGSPDDARPVSASTPIALAYADEVLHRIVARVWVNVDAGGARRVASRTYDGREWQPWVLLPPAPDAESDDAPLITASVLWRRDGLARLQLFGHRPKSGRLVELRQPFLDQWSWNDELARLQGSRRAGPPTAVAAQADRTYVWMAAENLDRPELLLAELHTDEDSWTLRDRGLCPSAGVP